MEWESVSSQCRWAGLQKNDTGLSGVLAARAALIACGLACGFACRSQGLATCHVLADGHPSSSAPRI